MPVADSAGRAVGTTVKGARLTARGGRQTARWVGRYVGDFRSRGGAGDTGMMRLLDLHAASCAGDTLVALGLAGTIFFNADIGEARGRVALYLFITMIPFALLAPLVGPLLDRFRHGRRWALAVTMLGRAFLAWLISDYIHGFGLYPAAFGVLALSRSYGVARSAAVPRLLPPGLGLSEAGARASIFGTVAGAIVTPIGLLAFKIGPQWPLRVSSLIFIAGAVVAMRLPPRADSDPPEVLPGIFHGLRRRGTRVLQGQLVVTTLIGSGILRALYGFLTLFLAFSIKSGDMPTKIFGYQLHDTAALGIAIGALGVGALVATAVGARMRIRRPLVIQAVGILAVTGAAVLAALFYTLGLMVLLAFVTAFAASLSKLAVDATIQERIKENVRASAFAHSETFLMLAWVLGGAIGLIPFPGRVGIILCAVAMAAATARAALLAYRLRHDNLSGVYADTAGETEPMTVAVPPPGTPGPTLILPLTSVRPPESASTQQVPYGAPPDEQSTERSSTRPKTRWTRRIFERTTVEPAAGERAAGERMAAEPSQMATEVLPRGEADQPTYHLYRPSTLDDDSDRRG
jgi:MFS family permease